MIMIIMMIVILMMMKMIAGNENQLSKAQIRREDHKDHEKRIESERIVSVSAGEGEKAIEGMSVSESERKVPVSVHG